MSLEVCLHELKKANLAFSTMGGIHEIKLCHVNLLAWELLLLLALQGHDAFGNLLEGFEGIFRNFEAYLAKHSQTNFVHINLKQFLQHSGNSWFQKLIVSKEMVKHAKT